MMLGRTMLNLLKQSPPSMKLQIVDPGCGTSTNLFDVYDVCAEFKQAEWFGLDLNQRETADGAGRSRYRVQ